MRSLVEQFQAEVFGLCVRMLRHRHDAEDVTQEVFVRIFRSLRRWDATRPLRPWVLGITVNRCRTWLSQRSRRPEAVDYLQEVAAGPPPDDAAELAAEILQSSARIGRHEAALQWTGRVLETIRSAARSGARSPADVARLELEQRGLEADIDADRRDRSALVRELGDLLGAPESWSPTISASHPGGALPTAADSASMVARADSFAEVRKAQSDVVIAELELTGAHAQKSVALSLTADAGWAGTGLSRWGPPGLAPNGTLSDRLRQDAGASVALELSRPLLAPGSELAVSAREASVSAARARLERVRREARRIALDLLGRWWYAAHDLPPLRSAAGQAESNLLRAQSLYVAGSLPLLDLLDARRVLEQSADRAEDAAGRLELALAQAEIWR